ncbi:hypothetical protein FNJ88_03910 [Chryseobacterium sp. SNU WT5]|uniref:phospholipase effector Tle1 domain-containing protein n=1 Tax=Chryseobacterium sp. SNU WT5 TaxID=2594269 RepID=UPI00118022AC|nr:DUF2235 domain-containing protein [Chryseobacterium sp. SNU WT5]QDP84736.1 hypothetical protein FNJ88_03910 [Chryseobacterium sp. SNU WT5]
MSQGLHLELETKSLIDYSFAQGELTLDKEKSFTVFIKEKKDLEKRILDLEKILTATPKNAAAVKEMADSKIEIAKFETVNWAWNTVYGMDTKAANHNEFVEKGISNLGKNFVFPEVLEGGGYCYIEAFFDGESPVGNIPNGIVVKATGKSKIIKIEWTDRQYNPIKDTKIAFGSQLLLHIYTQGLYGQEILVGLKDVNGLNKDLNIANSEFFEREVKTYPVQTFEDGQKVVSGLLVKDDNPKEAATTIQKAVIEVGIDHIWQFGQSMDLKGSFGDELQIETRVLQKATGKDVEVLNNESLKPVLNVSKKNGVKKDQTQEVTNMPVVVGEIDTVVKDNKEGLNFTFGVFIDGTLNNMYNTEMKRKMDSLGSPKKTAPKNTTGLGNLDVDDMKAIYKDNGDPDYSETSYENDLSNPAILFKNYIQDRSEDIMQFAIYTEGVGTHSAPKNQGGQLEKEDYKKDDIMQAPAFGAGDAGIRDKVRKSIVDILKVIKKNIKKEKEFVNTITFDVFGFSRGAAAARHFVHVVKHGPYVAKMGLVHLVEDLQKNPLPLSYLGKLMPDFGVLGQLLQEIDLLDSRTKVNVRFVGIYDTVPHHGLVQGNDAKHLGLHDVNKANYVVHMVAEDEYRANFDLVKISSVARTSTDSGKKGGMELTFPGVHCDVGGAYSEGGRNLCYRLLLSHDKDDLEKEKKYFIQQGWFKEPELNIKTTISEYYGKYRLEGDKLNVSNQYSFIPLHIMSGFCQKKEVPINDETLLEFKNFSMDHKKFLQKIKDKLWAYSFEGGEPIRYVDNGKENENLKNLRYHYLHWNATYGSPREAVGTWLSGKNHPNIQDGKRKRNVH